MTKMPEQKEGMHTALPREVIEKIAFDALRFMWKNKFDKKITDNLSYTVWKDSIDVDFPTIELEQLVRFVLESVAYPSLLKENEELRADLAKEKEKVVYLVENIEYSDSYGVHGSDFSACHLCNGGGAPGVSLAHEPHCPVVRCEETVNELWEERNEELKEQAEQRAEREELRDLLTRVRDELGYGGLPERLHRTMLQQINVTLARTVLKDRT